MKAVIPQFSNGDVMVSDLAQQVAQMTARNAMLTAEVQRLHGFLRANAGLIGSDTLVALGIQ
jgi:cell division protein FtsB